MRGVASSSTAAAILTRFLMFSFEDSAELVLASAGFAAVLVRVMRTTDSSSTTGVVFGARDRAARLGSGVATAASRVVLRVTRFAGEVSNSVSALRLGGMIVKSAGRRG